VITYPDRQPGSDPTLLRDELSHLIHDRLVNNPRGLQEAIGPSELGMTCTRKLGHRLARTPRVNTVPAWRTAIGTATHAWLADAFTAHNAAAVALGDAPRWLVETRVTVGTVAGEQIQGSADLFDLVTGTVIDWKVVGATSLRAARMRGPKPQYRSQVHCYARGFASAGHRVERVAIMFLPSAGDLSAAQWWSADYSEPVALEALSRADGLARALAAAGPALVLPHLPRTEDYCESCPFHAPGAPPASPVLCSGPPRNP